MKKINSLFFILIISIFVFCDNVQNDDENMEKIKEVKIKLVDFSIMTVISIQCDKYEKYFEKYNVFSLTDSTVVQQFMKQLINLEPIDYTYSESVDTRAKIELITDSDTSIVCVGKLSLCKDNKIYKTPQSIIDYLEKLNQNRP